MEYTVQNLEFAVSVFYNSEQNERVQAHQWLTTAQRCPEAWSFVWELLQSHKGTEVQFFAATTLHTKLLRCWNEVPPENYGELKNKILEAVLAFGSGPKIVLNRLCISLAAYIMQLGAADLASTLRPLSTTEHVSVLLEVLTVIPEEFNSMTMGASLRSRTRCSLQQACPAVLDDMSRHLESVYREKEPSSDVIQTWCKAATCAASWLALGGDENLCRDASACGTSLKDCLPLCQALLHVVHTVHTCEEVVSDSGLEACEAALSAVRAAGAAPDASRHPIAAMQLLCALAALARPILERDDVPNSPNEELLAAIFTCAVALGECHTRALVSAVERESPEHGSRDFLQLLLSCQMAPGHYPLHETRSQLSFGFWYMLQDEVTCALENSNALSETWRAVFSRLLSVLIQKSQAPADSSLTRDDAELLRCYRQDIADTVMYCYSVVGEACWSIVCAAWRDAPDDEAREAALHVCLALADAAPTQRAPAALSRLFQHAADSALSTSHPRLLHTSLECLGAYAAWLGSLEGPETEGGAVWARAALQAAGAALPRAPTRAALALRKLSAECQTHAAPLAQEITLAAQTGSGRYDGWVWRQLLGAAGAALAAAPAHVAAPLLVDLAQSLYKDLQAEGTEEGAERCGAAEAAAALVTALSTRQDLAAELMRRLLPALPPHARSHIRVPPLFQLLKQAVTVLMDECMPMMDELAQLALQALYTQPCPSGIDLIKLTVLMFGSSWDGCARLLCACVEACVRACSPDLAAAADVAEALFVALQAITKKKPQYLDSLGDSLAPLVQLGCDCVRLWEAGAARGACGWLAALAAERPAVLQPYAPALAASSVRCIGGATPRNQVEPLAALLLALNRAQWGEAPGTGDLGHWLRHALATPDFPSPHASQQHKQNFITAVLKEKSSKRRLLETVQEFSLVCRGLINTEYARQTLASRQLVA